ncbi:MAG: class I SAM-dependent methyltransferase [archaeon]
MKNLYLTINIIIFFQEKKKAKTILSELKNNTSIDTEKKLKVLAVGGEFGLIEYNLSNWTKWDIITSDMDEKSIKRYPQINEYVKTMVLDATKLHFKDNTFDLIIFNHVIEHIIDYKKAANELFRVLKKGGIMYVATPNLYRLLLKPTLLFMTKENISDEKRIQYHLGFSVSELIDILKLASELKNISKEHMIANSGIVGIFLRTYPKSFFNRYSQTNVFICIK